MALITVRAAAPKLGVSYSTLKRWIAVGRVRTTLTSGGHHRISDAEIDRLIAHGNPDTTKPRARPANADRRDHRRCGPGPQVAPRRRCDRGDQIDGSDDRAAAGVGKAAMSVFAVQ